MLYLKDLFLQNRDKTLYRHRYFHPPFQYYFPTIAYKGACLNLSKNLKKAITIIIWLCRFHQTEMACLIFWNSDNIKKNLRVLEFIRS